LREGDAGPIDWLAGDDVAFIANIEQRIGVEVSRADDLPLLTGVPQPISGPNWLA
jgi:hypothetical protein